MTTIRLGKKLIALRREANMTQEELASYMGVSKSSVSKWETETTLPDILLLPQLATLFNVSVDELIGYEPQLSMEAINNLYLQLSGDERANQTQILVFIFFIFLLYKNSINNTNQS